MLPPTLTHDSSGDVLAIGFPGDSMALSGQALASWHSEPGEIERDREPWVYPGTDIVFTRNMGLRVRPITLSGDIRCTDEGLVVLHETQDAWRFKGGLFTYDDAILAYAACEVVSILLTKNRRRITSGSWVWIVDYEIKLEQIAP